MKKRSLIILLFSILVGLVVIGVGTTYAWLTQEGNKEITYEVGDVNYEITLAENANTIVVPGQTITPEITIQNKSNVATQLRATFTIAKTGGDNETWTIGTSENDHLKLTLAQGWVFEDGYYYYGGADNTDDANKINPNTNVNSLFSGLVINGNKVGNAQSGATITITIKWQVKQADYIAWADMGNINFETGLPNA